MLRNYLMMSFRRMYRQKSSTVITVAGFSLGMVCCLFLFLVIEYESGVDTFHTKRDRIYRVVTDEQSNGTLGYTMGSPAPMAPALRADFPEVEEATRTSGQGSALVEVHDPSGGMQLFQEEESIGFVEPAFFRLFDFPWLAGSPASLSQPGTVALTESEARKFFGTIDVLGRTLQLDHKTDLAVIGVMKDLPAQTDFHFSMVISWATLEIQRPQMASWQGLSSGINTYVLLRPGMSPSSLEAQLPAFKNKYLPDSDDPSRRVHHLQPLTEIHHDGRYGNYAGHTASRTMLLALGLVGLFVLLTACINFVNMATAQAMTRAREVGVRKALGAVRSRLVLHYLSETFLLGLLSVLLAFALAEVLLPWANTLLGLSLSMSLVDNPLFIGLLFSLPLVVSLLGGIYPALVLSGFSPSLALKGQADRQAGKGVRLRQALVALQFMISQVLIIGTIIVAAQLKYWNSANLGFPQDALLTVELPSNDALALERLKTELLRDGRIQSVSFSYSSAVSGSVWDAIIHHTLRGVEDTYVSDLKFADADYARTYGLKFVAGRNYLPGDTLTELVVNETFARGLGLAPQDVVGKMFKVGSRPALLPVVGVVSDFHTRPLREQIHPTILASRRTAYELATVKLATQDLQGILPYVEKCWKTVFPRDLYNARFLDERIATFYSEEQKTSRLFQVVTAVAIFIGIIGLFGLVSFVASRRTKEIGVRKVLGAGVTDILWLFAKEFAALILVAFAVAAPLAFWLMSGWLENFAYRITPGPAIFALSIGCSFLVAALSVGYRIIRASLANPVEALRYE